MVLKISGCAYHADIGLVSCNLIDEYTSILHKFDVCKCCSARLKKTVIVEL